MIDNLEQQQNHQRTSADILNQSRYREYSQHQQLDTSQNLQQPIQQNSVASTVSFQAKPVPSVQVLSSDGPVRRSMDKDQAVNSETITPINRGVERQDSLPSERRADRARGENNAGGSQYQDIFGAPSGGAGQLSNRSYGD